MAIKPKKFLCSVLLAGIATLPIQAMAGHVSSTFQISVTVVADCNIQTPNMAFPQYSPSRASTVTTNLSVTCTRGTQAMVTATAPTTLSDGKGDSIQYSLNSATGAPMSSGVAIVGQGVSSPVMVPVNGVIQAGQLVPPGVYEGQQVVTVTF